MMLSPTVMCLIISWSTWTNAEIFTYESIQSSSFPHLSYVYKIEDKNKIYVFDELVTQDKVKIMQRYLSSPLERRQYMHQIEDNITLGLTPFHAVVNRSEADNFEFIGDAMHLLEKTFGVKVYLNAIHGEYLHSLDPKPAVQDECIESSYSAILFLNQYWLHNGYGQVSFYTMSKNPNLPGEPRLEVEQTIHPKPGRMIVWSSCLTYIMHPPSVNYFSNLMMLKMWFGTTQNEDKESVSDSSATRDSIFKITNSLNVKFGFEKSDRTIDYSKHLTRTFHDSQNRGIHVYDDLYTTDELRKLKRYLLAVANPLISEYDGSALEDHDNVQWIVPYNISDFIETPAWNRLQELLLFVSGRDQWFPYNIALNLVRPADHTRIHPDAELHQFEYTYLLYLTEGVTQNDFGETVFFDKVDRINSDGVHKFTNPGGEEFEPIASVWPKFGRVVLFRNVIEHSARPLSSSHLGCRYSFAVKVSPTKRMAIVKRLYEVMEYMPDMTNEIEQLNMELQQGEHDYEEDSSWTTKMLEEQLKNVETNIGELFVSKQHERVEELMQ